MKIGITMDKNDNVAIVTENINAGDVLLINEQKVIAGQSIPRGHKIATADILENEYIIKYGVPIGKAKRLITKGEHVHVHNVIDITSEINDVSTG